ncbi:MAG: hypothetical protein ACRCRZ_01760 [Metamycoplasmataceae bacterium]
MDAKTIKFKYLEGLRPTPMLAFYNKVQKEEYDLFQNYQYGEFTSKFEHYWNIGSYIIVDKKEKKIIAYAIENANNFLWLLRVINMNLTFEASNDFYAKFNDVIKNAIPNEIQEIN